MLQTPFKIRLTVFFVLILTVLSQGQVSSCIYNQRFSFFSTVTTKNAGQYNLTLPWRSAQNFTNYSITLTGFKIPASILVGYDVWMSSVTTAGTDVHLNINTGSQLIAISFQIVLAKPCIANVILQNIGYTPVNFSSGSRPSNLEFTNVYPGFTFGANTNLYQSEAFITSYSITSTGNWTQQLFVDKNPIVAGQNYQVIRLFSMTAYSNSFSFIRFTYILMDFSNINSIAYYNLLLSTAFSSSVASFNNFDIPAVFNPLASQKCIISLKWFRSLSSNPIQISLTDTGTGNMSNFSTLLGDNLFSAAYSRFCIQQCSPSTYVDYQNSTTACIPSIIDDCLVLASSTSCSQCVSNYFLYSNNTQCVLVCPSTYYGNSTTYTCQKCNNGFAVQGGCTSVIGCFEVAFYLNYQCIACHTSLFFDFVNGTCVCASGYSLVTHLCTNITGCITVIQQNNSTSCAFCDVTSHFIISNGTCICDIGLYLNNSNMCAQICGDGMLINLPCDDGNNDDGDGCSSTCSIEKSYSCVNGSASSPSQCIYMKKDIVLKLARIDRLNLNNTGLFTFSISPTLVNFKKINLVRSTSFECSQSIQVTSTVLQGNYLTVTLNFFEDLQTYEANFSITLNSSYFAQDTARLRFEMVSNGAKLLLIKDFPKLNLIEEGIKMLAYVILGIFLLSFLVHKMIGVEMINTFQVIYFVHLINPSYTAPYSLLKFLFPTILNLCNNSYNLSSIYSRKEHIVFNKDNEEFTLVLISCISITFIVFIIFFRGIIILSLEGSYSQQQKRNGKRFQFLEIAQKITYKYIIFPFFTGTFLVTMLLLKRQRQLTETSRRTLVLSMIQLFLTIFVFFYEQKALFIEHIRKYKGFMGLSRCHYQFISIYITFLLVVALIIKLAFLFEGSQFNAELFLLSCYLAFLVFMIGSSPYQATVHNFGLVINILLAVYFLMWSALKRLGRIDEKEQTQIFMLSLFLLLVLASLVATVIRIIYECFTKWNRVMANKLNCRIGKQNENQLSDDKNCKKQLKQQQSLMMKFSKNQVHRYSQIQLFLFAPIRTNTVSIDQQQVLKKEMRTKFKKKFKQMEQKQLRDQLF